MKTLKFNAAAPLILLAVAACSDPAPAPEARAEAPAPAQTPDPDAPPPLGPAEPVELTADETWRQRVAGRWSELPNCGGMTWNFQAGSFTTPGETHCADVAVADSGGGAVRVTGASCTAEGSAQDDIVMDVRPDDGTIDVTGIGNPISTQGWMRCE